jgi:hypothetical protein
MVLLHMDAFAALRQELIESVGMDGKPLRPIGGKGPAHDQ